MTPVETQLSFAPGKVLALLVDRDADTRLMYAEYLTHLQYEVEEALDGREALAKASALHPSVIVTDSRLPGISGIELCRLLRSDPLTRAIPIVVVTADQFTCDAKVAEAAGATAVLLKPCLPDRLAAEIRNVLARSHASRVPTAAIDHVARPQLVPPPRRHSEASDRRVRRKR